ncbi:hypothetical protein [Psychrobacillus sp. NPDC093180]|uniref:hypothetical protein n=1 Tax=Psychrobacillus sp. NPDC093180 TaxID=3364489 RepID=UPI0037F9C41E
MEKHIFTFGSAHPFWNKYVVIEAKTAEKAREEMFRCFGKAWSMQYTLKEFEQAKSEGFFRNLESLPTIRCESK